MSFSKGGLKNQDNIEEWLRESNSPISIKDWTGIGGKWDL